MPYKKIDLDVNKMLNEFKNGKIFYINIFGSICPIIKMSLSTINYQGFLYDNSYGHWTDNYLNIDYLYHNNLQRSIKLNYGTDFGSMINLNNASAYQTCSGGAGGGSVDYNIVYNDIQYLKEWSLYIDELNPYYYFLMRNDQDNSYPYPDHCIKEGDIITNLEDIKRIISNLPSNIQAYFYDSNGIFHKIIDINIIKMSNYLGVVCDDDGIRFTYIPDVEGLKFEICKDKCVLYHENDINWKNENEPSDVNKSSKPSILKQFKPTHNISEVVKKKPVITAYCEYLRNDIHNKNIPIYYYDGNCNNTVQELWNISIDYFASKMIYMVFGKNEDGKEVYEEVKVRFGAIIGYSYDFANRVIIKAGNVTKYTEYYNSNCMINTNQSVSSNTINKPVQEPNDLRIEVKLDIPEIRRYRMQPIKLYNDKTFTAYRCNKDRIISNPTGKIKASKGDYIMIMPNGDHIPISKENFEAMYEPYPDE